MSTPTPTKAHGSVLSYTIGFLLSLFFTIEAYLLVTKGLLHGWKLIYVLALFAVAQCTVQLMLFLHLGKRKGQRWQLLVFGFMLLVVVILVVGSLWIMDNLNSRMMPTDINHYLHEQDGI
jgi:cytochrome o ubiquinol oxidase subunit IV